MPLQHFEVGSLLQPGVTRYQESVKFDFYQSGPALFIFFEKPSEKEIKAIQTGKWYTTNDLVSFTKWFFEVRKE